MNELSERVFPLDNADQHRPDCQNQQDVDKAAHGVVGHHAQQPQSKQNNENGFQHDDAS